MILASASLQTSILTLVVALAYLLTVLCGARNERLARVVVSIAWALHGLLLVLGLSGAEPRFGFASALSVTVWLVAAVYFVERLFYPLLQVRWAMGSFGAVAVLLAWVFPGATFAGGASVWLPLHLALGIGSYGLFGAAVGHALLMGRAEERMRQPAAAATGIPLLTMERMTFRLVWAGFALLSATLLLAFTVGESLYGAPVVVRWDHKTVFSVLSWLVFAALLAGRWRLGWRGRRAARMLYAGSGLLFLAYVGSRFVFEVFLGRAP
ncbi:MAG: cytochrome c biogenesis protein CcsA [Rhodoferax sp.]|nr:cytochrome c biogenesis protein CcsA [Rhodoferax sp.]